MKFQIKSWWNGSVLFEADEDSMKLTLEAAVRKEVSLCRANLDGANLDNSTVLPTGETWKEYLEIVVPALLQAGGKTLDSCRQHWDCHDRNNCPMAHAFDARTEEETPLLLRPRVRQFVRLFDARLIPVSVLGELPAAEAAHCESTGNAATQEAQS